MQFWKVQDQDANQLVPGGGPLSDLQMAAFFLGLQMTEREKERGKNEYVFLFVFLWPHKGPHAMTSSNPNYFLKVPSPNTIRLEVGASA